MNRPHLWYLVAPHCLWKSKEMRRKPDVDLLKRSASFSYA